MIGILDEEIKLNVNVINFSTFFQKIMRTNTVSYAVILPLIILVMSCSQVGKRPNQDSAPIKFAYTIVRVWDLPNKLNEISGISFIGNNQVACVQDEDGIIFIYDLALDKIVQEVPFADPGDYEGIAVVKDDAYVMRSDGMLCQIKSYRQKEKKVSFSQTTFNAKNNMESLFYNIDTKSFLTTPKDKDIDDNFKNVYAIAFGSEKSTPAIKARLSMNDASFEHVKSKIINKTFNPSEIAVNNQNKDIFILDSKMPSILIMNAKGVVKQLYKLDKGDFAQPEGLTFSTDGRMFISNEAGKNGKPNIIEVRLDT